MGFIALNVVIICVVFTIGSNRIAFCDDRFTIKSTVCTSSCVVLGLSKGIKSWFPVCFMSLTQESAKLPVVAPHQA